MHHRVHVAAAAAAAADDDDDDDDLWSFLPAIGRSR